MSTLPNFHPNTTLGLVIKRRARQLRDIRFVKKAYTIISNIYAEYPDSRVVGVRAGFLLPHPVAYRWASRF
jgi:hypothetical protein